MAHADFDSLGSDIVKGKGKGKGPPCPQNLSKPSYHSQKTDQTTLRLKIRTGSLQPVPYTVVTSLDGTRRMELADGTSKTLPKDWQDEDGQWGILDERGAMGLDDQDAIPTQSSPHQSQTGRVALAKLIQQYPHLSEFSELWQVGVPVQALCARIRGQFGNDVADLFQLAAETGNQPVSGSDPPSEHEGTIVERHGLLGEASWPAPKLVAACSELARPGYNTFAAHEYLDADEVLQTKVSKLADLIRKSKRLVIYGGAGLSTSAGISDYATRTRDNGIVGKQAPALRAQPISPYAAKPSFAHRAIAALSQAGLLWRFIQQNHDGLPQKAGVPQHLINEIHGGWFDPSNPVVPMSGQLRNDLFNDLLECERKADLVLVLGSSLCGMNADRLVSTCASRARRSVPSDPAYGSIIVSLQRTPHDAKSALRVFATIDRVMELLLSALLLTAPDLPSRYGHQAINEDIFAVPYDQHGVLSLSGGHQTWDLRDGAEHIITIGPNKGDKATILGKNADGHYRVGILRNNLACQGQWSEVRLLGSWWIGAATNGQVKHLPIVNIM